MALPQPSEVIHPDGVYDFKFVVQVGKDNQSYKERYTFDHIPQSLPTPQVLMWYRGILVHSGYKKRLVRIDNKTGDTKVIERCLT